MGFTNRPTNFILSLFTVRVKNTQKQHTRENHGGEGHIFRTYLWFDHPELREVPRRVAVLCPEGRSERVNVP